jgi:hypothetical protein
MKQRKGFVSNSSSSSFVLLLPWEKPTLEQLTEYIGGFGEYHSHFPDEYISEQDILEYLHRDINLTKSIKVSNVKEAVTNNLLETLVEECYLEVEDTEFVKELIALATKYPRAFRNICESWKLEVIANTLDSQQLVSSITTPETKDMYAFNISYSDEDGGFFSALEHGNHWLNIERNHPGTLVITDNH